MQITLSSEGLWNMLQSLNPDAKRWLGEKLLEASEAEEEHLTPYTMEELHARIERSCANIKAGRVHTTEEVRRMIESKHPWLCK